MEGNNDKITTADDARDSENPFLLNDKGMDSGNPNQPDRRMSAMETDMTSEFIRSQKKTRVESPHTLTRCLLQRVYHLWLIGGKTVLHLRLWEICLAEYLKDQDVYIQENSWNRGSPVGEILH